MYQPRVLEVDSHRIKFNVLNPRKHGGEEYESLKSSIQEIGIVQPPLVREIAGGFYEVIDGEGRTSVAQELSLPKIKVISLGMVSDEEALTMLVTSNTVREFSFIARCKGIAELNRKGMKAPRIAKMLGMHERNAQLHVAFGYIPDAILQMIQKYPPIGGTPEVKKGLFSDIGETGLYFAFQSLLPLRQVMPGREPSTDVILDGTYDYTEVRLAVEKAVKGEIADITSLKAYVEQRRREIFESRFDQTLHNLLNKELDATKKALEEASEKQSQEAEERAKVFYEAQIQQLEAQFNRLQDQHNKTITDIAKQVDAKLVVQKREQEILRELERTLKEREKLKELERRMREDIEKEKERILAHARKEAESRLNEVDKQIKSRLEEKEKEYKEQEKSLQAYYAQKTAHLKNKATATVQQMCAAGVEHLAQAQQWVLHLTSPDVLPGVRELGQAELVALLAQMRVVYDLLGEVQESIQHGEVVSDESDIVSSDVNYSRSLVNGIVDSK